MHHPTYYKDMSMAQETVIHSPEVKGSLQGSLGIELALTIEGAELYPVDAEGKRIEVTPRTVDTQL